jgi:hypothetical protein
MISSSSGVICLSFLSRSNSAFGDGNSNVVEVMSMFCYADSYKIGLGGGNIVVPHGGGGTCFGIPQFFLKLSEQEHHYSSFVKQQYGANRENGFFYIGPFKLFLEISQEISSL